MIALPVYRFTGCFWMFPAQVGRILNEFAIGSLTLKGCDTLGYSVYVNFTFAFSMSPMLREAIYHTNKIAPRRKNIGRALCHALRNESGLPHWVATQSRWFYYSVAADTVENRSASRPRLR